MGRGLVGTSLDRLRATSGVQKVVRCTPGQGMSGPTHVIKNAPWLWESALGPAPERYGSRAVHKLRLGAEQQTWSRQTGVRGAAHSRWIQMSRRRIVLVWSARPAPILLGCHQHSQRMEFLERPTRRSFSPQSRQHHGSWKHRGTSAPSSECRPESWHATWAAARKGCHTTRTVAARRRDAAVARWLCTDVLLGIERTNLECSVLFFV